MEKITLGQILGKYIAGKRRGQGFSQEQLSEKIGVSCDNLCLMEEGKQTILPETLVQIASALNTTSGKIMEEVENVANEMSKQDGISVDMNATVLEEADTVAVENGQSAVASQPDNSGKIALGFLAAFALGVFIGSRK